MRNKKSSYQGYRKYYSTSSEAVDFDSMPPHGNRKKLRKKRIKRKPSMVYVDVGQNKAKISRFAVVSICLVFLCAMGLSFSSAVLQSKQLTISKLNKELKKMKDENQVLLSDISKSYDLQEIERIAINRLGMSKPKPHQIVYIQVPKQSYAIQNSQTEIESPQVNFFEKVAHFVFQSS